jgi:hypothetical protein
VEEWNPFVGAMLDTFLIKYEGMKALAKMKELKDKGDIASYLTDMETLNDKVCQVGSPGRTMLRNGHLEDIQ